MGVGGQNMASPEVNFFPWDIFPKMNEFDITSETFLHHAPKIPNKDKCI